MTSIFKRTNLTVIDEDEGTCTNDHQSSSEYGDENYNPNDDDDHHHAAKFNHKKINWSNEMKEELRDLAKWYVNDFSFFDVKKQPSSTSTKAKLEDNNDDNKDKQMKINKRSIKNSFSRNKLSSKMQPKVNKQLQQQQSSTKDQKQHDKPKKSIFISDQISCISNIDDEYFHENVDAVGQFLKTSFSGTSKDLNCTDNGFGNNYGPFPLGTSFHSYYSNSKSCNKKSVQTKIVKGLSTKSHHRGRLGGVLSGRKNSLNSSGGKEYDFHPQIILINPATKKKTPVHNKNKRDLSNTDDYLRSVSSSRDQSLLCDVSTISGSEDSPRMKLKFWKR